MRRSFALSLLLVLGLLTFARASSPDPAAPAILADDAVSMLKEGNARFASGQSTHPNQTAERRADTAAKGQHPFATVIGCSDSREPLEVIFDQGVGDLFVIRVAGNVAGPDELASIEYGVGHLGTPVLLVLGHTSCGAVTAAVQNAKVHGNLPLLINQIKPAVARAKAWSPDAGGDDLLAKAIKANVWLTMENLLRKSAEVRELVQKGRLLVIGGIYDLHSGRVNWLGTHPDQGKLLAAESKPHVKRKPKPAAVPDEAQAKGESKAQSKDSSGAADQGSMLDTGPADAEPAPKAQAGKPAPEARPGKPAPAHP